MSTIIGQSGTMFSHDLSSLHRRNRPQLGLTVAEGIALFDDSFNEGHASSSTGARKTLQSKLLSILSVAVCTLGWTSQASCPFCYPKKSWNSLPATNDRFAGECQIQKALPDFKWKGILQCVAINNQGNIIFLAQWLPKTGTMLSQRSSCCLKDKQKENVSS